MKTYLHRFITKTNQNFSECDPHFVQVEKLRFTARENQRSNFEHLGSKTYWHKMAKYHMKILSKYLGWAFGGVQSPQTKLVYSVT